MPRLAVLGHPVSHSRSPAMQNAALAELGLAGEWSYEAIDVSPDEFESRVRSMPGEGFAGANVTVPYKTAALALADSMTEMAREIGAANTLVFQDGEIHADNTDATALVPAMAWAPKGARTLVLGAGGAARAMVWALLIEGAEVEVWNRTELRSQHLCQELGGQMVTAPNAGGYELIINTTAVGLRGENPFEELPLTPESFSPQQTVVDLVYGDEPTRLLAAAAEAGARVVDGIELLVYQGAQSFRLWTGLKPPVETMRAAARL